MGTPSHSHNSMGTCCSCESSIKAEGCLPACSTQPRTLHWSRQTMRNEEDLADLISKLQCRDTVAETRSDASRVNNTTIGSGGVSWMNHPSFRSASNSQATWHAGLHRDGPRNDVRAGFRGFRQIQAMFVAEESREVSKEVGINRTIVPKGPQLSCQETVAADSNNKSKTAPQKGMDEAFCTICQMQLNVSTVHADTESSEDSGSTRKTQKDVFRLDACGHVFHRHCLQALVDHAYRCNPRLREEGSTLQCPVCRSQFNPCAVDRFAESRKILADPVQRKRAGVTTRQTTPEMRGASHFESSDDSSSRAVVMHGEIMVVGQASGDDGIGRTRAVMSLLRAGEPGRMRRSEAVHEGLSTLVSRETHQRAT